VAPLDPYSAPNDTPAEELANRSAETVHLPSGLDLGPDEKIRAMLLCASGEHVR
jgi:hypothetical protein